MSPQSRGAGNKPAPFFVALVFLIGSSGLYAEVPVVDIEDRQTVTPVQAGPASNTATRFPAAAPATASPASRQNQLADLFIQMQQLQQEVQSLRGLVEQQAHELETLKQQQKDNYIDLDRRIGALSATAAAAPPVAPASPVVDPGVAAAIAASSEKDSYDAAYRLLDENRKDEAITAFTRHLVRFPDGEYAGNAYYWLGLIQSTQGQLAAAQEQFTTLLKKFPDHRKAADARFALGKVYFQQGKKAEAKKIIQEVAQGNTSAAAPAKAFLQANF